MTERIIHFDNRPFEIGRIKANELDSVPEVSESSEGKVAEAIPVSVDRFQLIRIGLELSKSKGNNVEGHLAELKGRGRPPAPTSY